MATIKRLKRRKPAVVAEEKKISLEEALEIEKTLERLRLGDGVGLSQIPPEKKSDEKLSWIEWDRPHIRTAVVRLMNRMSTVLLPRNPKKHKQT